MYIQKFHDRYAHRPPPNVSATCAPRRHYNQWASQISGLLVQVQTGALQNRLGLRLGHGRSLGCLDHVSIEGYAYALHHSQNHASDDKVRANMTPASSHSESASGHCARKNGIPRVLGLSQTLDGAIVCGKHTTPCSEVSAKRRCSQPHRGADALPSLAVGRVPEPFNAVPDGATNRAHRECTTVVIHNDKRTRVATVVSVRALTRVHIPFRVRWQFCQLRLIDFEKYAA